MVSQVCHSVVNGAAQEILAVVEFAKAHPFSLSPAFLSCVSPVNVDDGIDAPKL